jgi:MFS family permease
VKDETPRASRGYYHGWNIVAVCIVSQFTALGILVNCFSLFVEGWHAAFGTPISTLATGITLFSLSCAVWAPWVGVLAERFELRKIMVTALLGVALVHVAIAWATAGWQIVALYSLVAGLVITFCTGIPSQTLVARWFVHRRGLAMGLTAFGIAMAGVIFPPVVTWLLPLIGWRQTWLVFAALIGFVVTPLVFFALREHPTLEEGAAYIGAPTHDALTAAITVREILTNRNFLATIAAFTTVQSATMVLAVSVAPLVTSRGYALSTAALLISTLSVAALVAKLLAGAAADRFGNGLPLRVATLVCAAGCFALAAGSSLPAMLFAVVLIGLGQGVWTLIASATAVEFGPAGFGRAFGLMSMLTSVATIASPVVAWLVEHHISYSQALVGLGAFAVMGFGAACFYRKPSPEPAKD